jgi:hypothetical protein
MSIVLFLGKTVKEYMDKNVDIIEKMLINEALLCDLSLKPMGRHSKYCRKIKETGIELSITVIRCKPCNRGHALLPDFLLPRKHYSGDEIESVIIDSAIYPLGEIETEASEPTVRRWIKQIGERVKGACGILRYLFGRAGKVINELRVAPGPPYSEVVEILGMAPETIKCCGNRLGLANLWIGTSGIRSYI